MSKHRTAFFYLLIPLLIVGLLVFGAVFLKKKPSDEKSFDKPDAQYFSETTEFAYFPVRFEDFVVPAKTYGLWPYGIRGENKDAHNEGHPGWDFELKKGSKVYALGDLLIQQIHTGDKPVEGREMQVIEAYSFLGAEKFHIVYHSVVNLEPGVKEGATIKAGQPLAEAGFPLSNNSVMIHFGIFPPFDSVGSCPTTYFSKEVQEVITQIVGISINHKTNQPYTSACLGKISRRLYEQNYPERIKDFGGAEPFE